MAKINNSKLNVLFSYLMLTIGCVVAALALECFLIPNTILDGGITGISINYKYSIYLYWIQKSRKKFFM